MSWRMLKETVESSDPEMELDQGTKRGQNGTTTDEGNYSPAGTEPQEPEEEKNEKESSIRRSTRKIVPPKHLVLSHSSKRYEKTLCNNR